MDKNRLTPHARFVRGQIVYLDFDIAPILGVSTRYLNQIVKRNQARFPVDFCFQVTQDELHRLRFSPGSAPPRLPHLRYRPYVFTNKGLFMASTLLKTESAIATTIHMLRTIFAGPLPKSPKA